MRTQRWSLFQTKIVNNAIDGYASWSDSPYLQLYSYFVTLVERNAIATTTSQNVAGQTRVSEYQVVQPTAQKCRLTNAMQGTTSPESVAGQTRVTASMDVVVPFNVANLISGRVTPITSVLPAGDPDIVATAFAPTFISSSYMDIANTCVTPLESYPRIAGVIT